MHPSRVVYHWWENGTPWPEFHLLENKLKWMIIAAEDTPTLRYPSCGVAQQRTMNSSTWAKHEKICPITWNLVPSHAQSCQEQTSGTLFFPALHCMGEIPQVVKIAEVAVRN